jgi:hypothetical protein
MRYSARYCYEAALHIARAHSGQSVPPRAWHAGAATYFSSEATTIRARSTSSVLYVESVPATDLFGHLHGPFQARTRMVYPTAAADEKTSLLNESVAHDIRRSTPDSSNAQSRSHRHHSVGEDTGASSQSIMTGKILKVSKKHLAKSVPPKARQLPTARRLLSVPAART